MMRDANRQTIPSRDLLIVEKLNVSLFSGDFSCLLALLFLKWCLSSFPSGDCERSWAYIMLFFFFNQFPSQYL